MDKEQKLITHTFHILKDNKSKYYKKSIEDHFTDQALEFFTENPSYVDMITLGKNEILIRQLEKYFEDRKKING